MNKVMGSVLLSGFLALGGLVQAGEGKAGHGYSIEHKMEKLTKKLNLTPDQQASIRAILEEQKAKKEGLTSKEQKQAVRLETQQRIRAVLTDEQKAKYDAIKNDMGKAKKKSKKDL
jgi:Spy/CpxP family protein refolding chaperone